MTQQMYATRGGGQQTPAAVCTLRRRDDGTLELASATQALEALLGASATLAGAAADAVLPSDLVRSVQDVLDDARPRQVAFDAPRGGAPQSLVAVVVPDGNGGALCSVVDATRAQATEFESIVENAPDIIARIDRSFRHAYVNLAIEQATGRPREEFIGKDHVELGMPDELVRYFQSVYRQVFETGEEGRKEFDFPTPDGGVRSYSSRVVPERGPSGRVETVLSVARDVTSEKRAMSERVEMERRLSGRQRLESLGMLAGGVAHDFNNLLQTVLGTASLVRRGVAADATVHGDLEQIENACLQASDLCRQLLTYAGQQSPATDLVDVEEVVAESEALLTLSLSKKIAFDFERRGGVLPVRADASQLRQILMNLVINASEAIGNVEGRIRVAVDLVGGDDPCFDAAHLLPEQREPEYVRLEVSDDGSGMDPETLARIFEPFYSTKFAGRGLGLAATLGIVRGHEGAIAVRSTPGVGTTFQVMLPASEGRPSRSIPVVGPADWTTEATLLVVDDHDAVRHTAARMAEEVGLRHDQIILSAKVSRVPDMWDVYRRLAAACDYPLHLGLTEAGMGMKGQVWSAASMGILLAEGIGDTIRISLTPRPGGDRRDEVYACQELLQALGLRQFAPSITACPGCGRTTSTTFQELANETQEYVRRQMPLWRQQYEGVEGLKVAVMGCVVNGPGESKAANIGISLPGNGEDPVCPVYVDGQKYATYTGSKDELAAQFRALLDEYVDARYRKKEDAAAAGV